MKKRFTALALVISALLLAASCQYTPAAEPSPSASPEASPSVSPALKATPAPPAQTKSPTAPPPTVEPTPSPDTGTGGIPTPGNVDSNKRDEYYQWLKSKTNVDPEISWEVADAAILKFAEALATGSYSEEIGPRDSYYKAELRRKSDTLLIEIKLLAHVNTGAHGRYDSLFIDDMGEVKLGPSAEF